MRYYAHIMYLAHPSIVPCLKTRLVNGSRDGACRIAMNGSKAQYLSAVKGVGMAYSRLLWSSSIGR